jgi:Tol biopolymer transport system component
MENILERSTRDMRSTTLRWILAPLFILHFIAPPASAQGTAKRVEKIAFYSTRSGIGQIYMMDIDGGGLQRLTNDASKNRSPVISPDGTQIAFASERDGTSRIYLMNIDGSRQRRLTAADQVEILPAWSPDGTKVYFQIETLGGNSILAVAAADGSGLTKLTDGSVGYNYLMMSPDGREDGDLITG